MSCVNKSLEYVITLLPYWSTPDISIYLEQKSDHVEAGHTPGDIQTRAQRSFRWLLLCLLWLILLQDDKPLKSNKKMCHLKKSLFIEEFSNHI